MRAPRAATVLVAASLSVFALLLVAGHGPWAGPSVLTLVGAHGVNVGDIPVALAWAASVWALLRLDRGATRGRPPGGVDRASAGNRAG